VANLRSLGEIAVRGRAQRVEVFAAEAASQGLMPIDVRARSETEASP